MGKRNPFGICALKQYPKALRHARKVAKEHGYAIGLHGSRLYDLDLIAAPWAEPCSAPDVLANAIACRLGWFLHKGPAHSSKPHGRLCYLIFGPEHAHIDLSVMPIGDLYGIEQDAIVVDDASFADTTCSTKL